MLTLYIFWTFVKAMFTFHDYTPAQETLPNMDWYNPHALRHGRKRQGDFCFGTYRVSKY